LGFYFFLYNQIDSSLADFSVKNFSILTFYHVLQLFISGEINIAKGEETGLSNCFLLLKTQESLALGIEFGYGQPVLTSLQAQYVFTG
jgi:hypothetical protein